MEYLVDMITTVPEGTSQEAIDGMLTRNGTRSREPSDQGIRSGSGAPHYEPVSAERSAYCRLKSVMISNTYLLRCRFVRGASSTSYPLSIHPNDPALGPTHAERDRAPVGS